MLFFLLMPNKNNTNAAHQQERGDLNGVKQRFASLKGEKKRIFKTMQVVGNDQMVTVLVSPKHTDAIVHQQVLKSSNKA